MEYKSILLAFHNEQDISALQAALAMAEKYSATLKVLHINTHMSGAPSRTSFHIDHKYTLEELTKVVGGYNKHQASVVIDIVKDENIIGRIQSESKSCDLLVLSHRHMGFFESYFSDSTDQEILEKTECHCLVVPVS